MTSAGRFDWHSDPIARDTPVTEDYRNIQNVRRFFWAQYFLSSSHAPVPKRSSMNAATSFSDASPSGISG